MSIIVEYFVWFGHGDELYLANFVQLPEKVACCRIVDEDVHRDAGYYQGEMQEESTV
jgi:hypothetical protein